MSNKKRSEADKAFSLWLLAMLAIILSLSICQPTRVTAETNDRPTEKTTPIAVSPISIKAADIEAKDIYIGSVGENIIPYCVVRANLFKEMPEAQQITRDKVERGTGRYWILSSQASDHMINDMKAYVGANKISFLCERDSLLALLRKREEYKNSSDEELITAFDITKQIIAFGKTQPKGKTK